MSEHSLMILNFDVLCKDYKQKIFETVTSDTFHHCTCPKCGAKKFHRHASYDRYVILFTKDVPTVSILELLRMQCVSCKSTHAILPSDMIPFSLYSVPVFLHMLKLYILENNSLNQTTKAVSVSFSTLLLKLRIFQRFMPYIEQYLRIYGFYEKEASLSKVTALSYLFMPTFDYREFFRCHHLPIFLNRRTTISYPLRFTDFIS